MAKETMLAMVAKKYGAPHKVLKLEEVPVPTPRQKQVLVKIHAAGVNASDWHLIRASPMFLRFATGLFAPKFPVGASYFCVIFNTFKARLSPIYPDSWR